MSHSSPLAVAHQVSRAKALGLRVGIDGTCLGPKEMGTQVQTLHIIRALADHDDVREVTVALSGPIPRYAQETLTHTKVRVAGSHEDDMSDIGAVDVLHRPFQPQRRLDIEAWRKSSPRIMVSILDLIGYRNAAYHDSPQTWLLYRDAVRTTIEKVDGVSVISADVKDQMLLDRMPIDSERIFVAELGTDHMTGAEAERIPTELVRRGFGNDEFVLVLGATYAHKNRDQAVRAVQELRAAGRELSLVMVGAAVPQGSSRRRRGRRPRRSARPVAVHDARRVGRGAQLAAPPRRGGALPHLRRGLRVHPVRGRPHGHADAVRAVRPSVRAGARPAGVPGELERPRSCRRGRRGNIRPADRQEPGAGCARCGGTVHMAQHR